MSKKQHVVLSKRVPDSSKYRYVIGVDEVGWGAIAGPIGIAVVVFPWEYINNDGLKDSKRYSTDKSRGKAAEIVKEQAIYWDVMFSHPETVEEYGPAQALNYIQRKIVQAALKEYPESLVVMDGNKPCSGVKKSQQLVMPKADSFVPAVSAASILAKVIRDTYMVKMSEEYPMYDFHKNKGYPTPQHLAILKELGPTELHRFNIKYVTKSFKKKGWYDGEE